MAPSGRSSSSARKRIRTGVAISAVSLTAADIRVRTVPGVAWRVPLEAPSADGASWPSLAAAFAELARALGAGTAGGSLAVTLLPPLTEVRRLDLPPLRPNELQRLLMRNAARYFVHARGPQAVGAAPVVRRGRGAPVPVVAASASARLVAAIHAAAAQSGWSVESISPAEGAWAAASMAIWPVLARQSAFALVAQDDRTDLAQLENGRLVAVRRFRAGASDAPMIADTIGTTARVGVVGSAPARRELSAALAAHGISVAAPSGDLAHAADEPDLLAARFADSEIGPVLRSDDHAAGTRDRARRVAWAMTAAAAALVLLAAGIQYWGVRRQLRSVQAERAQLRPALAATLLGRTTVEGTFQELATLDTIDRSSPQWSAVIATLTRGMPREAHLTALRARDDSLVVDGLADHAAHVFDAMTKTRGLGDVKAAASVRREQQEGGGAKEHFVIAARVAPGRGSTQ